MSVFIVSEMFSLSKLWNLSELFYRFFVRAISWQYFVGGNIINSNRILHTTNLMEWNVALTVRSKEKKGRENLFYFYSTEVLISVLLCYFFFVVFFAMTVAMFFFSGPLDPLVPLFIFLCVTMWRVKTLKLAEISFADWKVMNIFLKSQTKKSLFIHRVRREGKKYYGDIIWK